MTPLPAILNWRRLGKDTQLCEHMSQKGVSHPHNVLILLTVGGGEETRSSLVLIL